MDRRHFLLLAPAAAQAAPTVDALRVAGPEEPGDRRFDYAHQLLQLALSKSGQSARLDVVKGLTQRRQMRELEAGYLDVGLLASNLVDTDHHALSVSQPIRRGLLGVRLLLTRPDRAARLAASTSLAELAARCRFGHGADWADLGTMRQAGLNVKPLPGYRRLFDAVRDGSVDALSRSVNEVWDELANPALAGTLVVVPRIALYYPMDDFFWVNPKRPDVARAIDEGLQAARRDGSFQALLKAHYGAALDRARMKERQVFRFPVAPLPDHAPAQLFDVLSALAEPA